MTGIRILLFVLVLSLYGAVNVASADIQPSSVTASAPAPIPTPVPVGTPPGPAVAVAEPAAPPPWAQELVMAAEKLPVVGPVISKFLLYAGIIGSIMTAVVVCLVGILNTLIGAFNIAKLVQISNALAAFKDGKIMYYLKFFSFFNAKKKDSDA